MSEVVQKIITALVVVVFAPIIGGLVTGTERKISARLQGRYGPSILQPFYDILKLMAKEKSEVVPSQFFYVAAYLVFNIISLVALTLGADLVIVMLIFIFSNLVFAIGTSTIESPYSKIGAQREFIQILAYGPILLISVLAVKIVAGSFVGSFIFKNSSYLIIDLPLVFTALMIVFNIKMKKSPFDLSQAPFNHQEIVKGITLEYSGYQLAMIMLTNFYEITFLMLFVLMFFTANLYLGIGIALFCVLLQSITDNITARLTYRQMIIASWLIGGGAAAVNIIWVYLK